MSGRHTILYVDDSENDAVLMRRACAGAMVPFQMQVVSDGERAISYLSGAEAYSDRARHPLPGVIMLDLKMPRKNGFEVLQWIRSQPQFRILPVIIFSSSRQEDDMRRAYGSGANSYLVKPVDFDALVEMIGSIARYWLTLNQAPPG